MGINFCTIPQRVIGASIPQFGTYDETFDEQLRPYILHLCKVRDQRVECPEATRLLEQLTEECRDIAILSQDRIYENFTFRALVIAYLKACVLYVANGCKWEAEMDEFIRWSLHYDLWCKMRFFYDLAKEQLEEANRIGERGPKNLLQQLPDEFTWGQVESARIDNGMDIAGTREMIKTWMKRGYLLYDRDDQDVDEAWLSPVRPSERQDSLPQGILCEIGAISVMRGDVQQMNVTTCVGYLASSKNF